MSPIASYIALRTTGPPTQVSFLPAFWLLVPGALGLIGLTQLFDNDQADAFASLLSSGTTVASLTFRALRTTGPCPPVADPIGPVARPS